MSKPSRPHRVPADRCRWQGWALLCAALLPAGLVAAPPLPQRDLLVELREADAAQAPAGVASSGWNVRSADAGKAREQPAQQLRVRNGASASLRLTVTRPLQVWQAAPGAWLPVPLPQTQWITTGQNLTLQPRWSGGREPVSVAVSVDSSRLDPHVAPGSAELPQRTGSRIETTLDAPLGQWVTLAATGADSGAAGSVASGEAAARRVLQLRVSLQP
jgi:hypothetical protein